MTPAHGVHMPAYVAPSDSAMRQLSSNAARVSGVAARDSYRIGDFARLAQGAMPDPNAAEKLNALADLVWRTAQSQRDPQLREAMFNLVNRYCIMPPRCYHG